MEREAVFFGPLILLLFSGAVVGLWDEVLNPVLAPERVVDILNYRIFTSKKVDKKLLNLISEFQSKIFPTMPISGKDLMEKYNFPEGKNLGNKLKIIEEEWVNNNFELTDKQINKIINR